MFRVSKVNENAKVPARGRDGDAGYDLSSCENVVIPAHHYGTVDTGIAIDIPSDCYARVAPRSGLACKHGIQVGAGVVDSNYRGTIRVLLFNHGTEPFLIQQGDRIAQLIFERIYTPTFFEEVAYEELTNTARGANGFGSSGTN